MPSHTYNPGSSVPVMTTPAPNPSGPLVFKESPFFTVVESLTPVVECKSMLRFYHFIPRLGLNVFQFAKIQEIVWS